MGEENSEHRLVATVRLEEDGVEPVAWLIVFRADGKTAEARLPDELTRRIVPPSRCAAMVVERRPIDRAAARVADLAGPLLEAARLLACHGTWREGEAPTSGRLQGRAGPNEVRPGGLRCLGAGHWGYDVGEFPA